MLRYLGYAGQEYSPSLDGRIDAAIGHALAISEPKGVMRPFEVERIDEGENPCVHLKGTALKLPGHDIAEHLAGAQAAAYVECRTGDGRIIFGAGIDSDVSTASVKALLNAANRTLAA